MLRRVHKLGRYLFGVNPFRRHLFVITVRDRDRDSPVLLRLLLELDERQRAHLALDSTQRDALVEDVDAHDFLFAERGGDDLSFLRESLAALDVELVLIAQAAHQAAARAGDLGRVERQPLILGDAEVHRSQLREP